MKLSVVIGGLAALLFCGSSAFAQGHGQGDCHKDCVCPVQKSCYARAVEDDISTSFTLCCNGTNPAGECIWTPCHGRVVLAFLQRGARCPVDEQNNPSVCTVPGCSPGYHAEFGLEWEDLRGFTGWGWWECKPNRQRGDEASVAQANPDPPKSPGCPECKDPEPTKKGKKKFAGVGVDDDTQYHTALSLLTRGLWRYPKGFQNETTAFGLEPKRQQFNPCPGCQCPGQCVQKNGLCGPCPTWREA